MRLMRWEEIHFIIYFSFSQVRLPPNTSDDVDEDPTGNKALWDRGLLNGASQKVKPPFPKPSFLYRLLKIYHCVTVTFICIYFEMQGFYCLLHASRCCCGVEVFNLTWAWQSKSFINKLYIIKNMMEKPIKHQTRPPVCFYGTAALLCVHIQTVTKQSLSIYVQERARQECREVSSAFEDLFGKEIFC